ncbi:efflux transporter outer membrane subunit [Methylobacter psychrophilus]|uniref:efflux transporter outer membrane subunit n=1 Tax=Methylobacter psychrophilus TaxID=96941 RepID=UPI0021D4CF92|nr:efflux transporter outer membrane subunit [Methylobacter psychrophilus]
MAINNNNKCYSLVTMMTAAMLGSSCSLVGPDYVKPESAVETKWINQLAPEISQRSVELSTWWKVFNDPVLDKLIAEARLQNLNLQVAGTRILEARAQLGIVTSNEYPQLQQMNGDLSKQQISAFAPNTSSLIDRSYASTGIGFDMGWELDLWGKFRRGVESSVANLEASVAGYDDVLVSLTAEVARTYVLVRTSEIRIQVARDNVKIQERTLEIAKALFSGGLINELDYLQAESLLSNTRASIPPLEAELRQAKNALSVLLGRTPGTIDSYLTESKPIPVAPAQVAIGVPAELLRRRPDIRLAERQLATQSALIGVAKADLYPHFSLLGSISLRASDAALTYASMGGSTLGQLFNAKSFQYFIGPSISWDIFNYGRITNQVRVEDARFQSLVGVYRNTVLNAAKEAEDSTAGFLNAQQQRDQLQLSYAAAKRSTDLSLYQYSEGLVDYQRVLDSQRTLATSQSALASTTGNIAINLIALYKAVGGGWETREEQDFVPEAIKKTMAERSNWGSLMQPKKLDLPEQDKRKQWRFPDW